jgi:2-dehydro-3-deoxyglucarate aldolase/4-hydroxy-2-oxoheptanedioate aldolase
MLIRRQPVDLVWLSLGSTALAEMAAHSKPSAIVIDLQHGLWDRLSLEAAVGIARSFTQVLVRVADNTPHAISQALDAGANGVIVPLIETAEQAAQAVAHAHYPPEGTRSAGGLRPLLAGMNPARTNRDVVVGLMIETMAGVAQAQAIVATQGIDFIFIGTGDLGISKGVTDPGEIRGECEQIKALCAARGLPCGLFTGSADQAVAEFRAGYDVAVTASDFGVFASGLQAAQAAMAAR